MDVGRYRLTAVRPALLILPRYFQDPLMSILQISFDRSFPQRTLAGEEPSPSLATPHPPLHRQCSPSLFRASPSRSGRAEGETRRGRSALANALRHAGMIFTHDAIEFNELFIYSSARREHARSVRDRLVAIIKPRSRPRGRDSV